MNTPYIGFGNDSLAKQPAANEGDRIQCPSCGRAHEIEFGTDQDGQKTDLLGFYRCGDQQFLGAVAGRLVAGLKPDVSGEI